MADGRKNNSGKIGNNGGRPPKSEEIALIARLSPMDDLALKLLNCDKCRRIVWRSL